MLGALEDDVANTRVRLIDVRVVFPKWTGEAKPSRDVTSDPTANGGGTANWQTSASLAISRFVETGGGQIDFFIFKYSAIGSTPVRLNAQVTPVVVAVTSSV